VDELVRSYHYGTNSQCTMIRHGDPGDPIHRRLLESIRKARQYPPAFPIPPIPNSTNPDMSRAWSDRTRAEPGQRPYLGLDYYKQLVPNAEVTLPTSTCATCVRRRSRRSIRGERVPWYLIEGLGGAICRPLASGNPAVCIRSDI